MTLSCVVIGASHAAAEVVSALRKEGWQGDITVFGEESYLPYHRPPLSKTFLLGNQSVEDILSAIAAFIKGLMFILFWVAE